MPFFGSRTQWHLLRLVTVLSLGVAVLARLGDGKWVDLFPIALLALLAALWLKPAIYARLEHSITSQPKRSVGWLIAVAVTAGLASLASGLMVFLFSRLTHSNDLPLSIWLIDLLLSILLVVIVYDQTQVAKSEDQNRPRNLWSFLIFFAFGLGMVWKALAYPMTWDDLHLIRFFSVDNLQSTWTGYWDPDRIETPGYRPLTTAFNHFRYILFREDVVLHRVFLVGLYAAFLARTVTIAQRFGLAWQFGVVGGLFAFAARQSVYHYVWLSDGIHLIQALLVVQTLFLITEAIRRHEGVYFVYAAVFAGASLLVREDNLILVPLALFMSLIYLGFLDAPPSVRRTTYIFCFGLVVTALSFYLLRNHLIDTDSSTLGLEGVRNIALLTFFGFTGGQSFDALSGFFVATWPLVLLLCAVLLIKLVYESRWQPSLLWFAVTVITCSVGLINNRANLLVFSVTAFGFFLATIIAALWARRQLVQAAVCLVVAVYLAGTLYISQTAIETFHPSADNVVYWNAEFVYGRHSHAATIPEQRAEAIKQQLAAFNIYSAADIPSAYQLSHSYADGSDTFSALVNQAMRQGIRRPAADGRFFVPLLGVFTP
ncbi:MAG: hypothetical protein KF698_06000 [Anaerolineales bacterium]|nr:hypothetical protein [Anaerolineales bacterium]